MPLIDGVHHEPAEAIALGRCPECGRPLAGVNITDEISRHWPRGTDPSLGQPEATRRAEMLKSHAAASAPPAPAPAEVE